MAGAVVVSSLTEADCERIRRMVRIAKNPRGQVGICAQLYAVTKPRILEILGVDGIDEVDAWAGQNSPEYAKAGRMQGVRRTPEEKRAITLEYAAADMPLAVAVKYGYASAESLGKAISVWRHTYPELFADVPRRASGAQKGTANKYAGKHQGMDNRLKREILTAWAEAGTTEARKPLVARFGYGSFGSLTAAVSYIKRRNPYLLEEMAKAESAAAVPQKTESPAVRQRDTLCGEWETWVPPDKQGAENKNGGKAEGAAVPQKTESAAAVPQKTESAAAVPQKPKATARRAEPEKRKQRRAACRAWHKLHDRHRLVININL